MKELELWRRLGRRTEFVFFVVEDCGSVVVKLESESQIRNLK
jgi:hypothetical protein